MAKPRVIVVGGMSFNIPRELAESVEIVKHVEQTASYRVGTLPAADYILVIADFTSHTLVDVVKNQMNSKVIYLQKGWASMKSELQRRSILPPDPSPTREPEAAPQEAPTTTGLSEDELWKIYRTKLIEAAKGALKPRELISENDLIETLGDLVGIPKEDCRRLLPNLQLGGTVVPVKDGIWSLMVGQDGYEFDPNPIQAPRSRRRPPDLEDGRTGHMHAVNASRTEQSNERARKIAGLHGGPYLTVIALIREMQKYKEFQREDGGVFSTDVYRRIVKRAAELHVVDDTHEKIFVDHNPDVTLTRTVPPDPEPQPIVQPPVSAVVTHQNNIDAYVAEKQKEKLGGMPKAEAEKHWAHVVNEVKRQKRHLGTILENGRIEWLADTAILIFFVPTEFSVYLSQLEATENWGLIMSEARLRFGPALVVRFVLDNSLRKVRV